MTGATPAYPRWRWSNPEPHGANIYDQAYSLGLVAQACERGQLFTSEDLIHWQPRATGTTNSLMAVTFFGSQLLAAGENGTLLAGSTLDDFQVISLGTPDWVMGLAASDVRAVAVGDNAALYNTMDGTNWSRQTPPNNITNWLRSVAFGKNTFIAVGEYGCILSSANGSNWKKETSGTTRHLNRVAYLTDTFWAVGDQGVVLTSASGSSWAPVSELSITNHLYGVAGVSNQVLLAGERTLWLRPGSGSPWINETDAAKAFPAPRWTYYTAVWADAVYLLGGRSGMVVEGFKTNSEPAQWILRNDSARTWLWDATQAGALQVAVGDLATIVTSLDGLNWGLEAVPDSATNAIFLGVGGTTNQLVVVGNRGTLLISTNQMRTVVSTNTTPATTNTVSELGVIWTAVPTGSTNDLNGVAGHGAEWVVCGGQGTLLFSTNASRWTPAASPTSAFLSSVCFYSNQWVASGDRGTLLTSTNGINWTQQTPGTTNWIYKVRVAGGRLLAVGEKGLLLTSTNGSNWQALASGTQNWLTDICEQNGRWIITGVRGTVLFSTNGTSWTSVSALSGKSMYAALANNDRVMAFGTEGAILRGYLSPLLSPVTITAFNRQPSSSGQSYKLWLFAGPVDQRFTLDSSPDLKNWLEGFPLEMFDKNGTLLILEESPELPQEFFRSRPTH